MFSFFNDFYFWYFFIGSCLAFSLSHYANFLRFSWKHSFGRYMNWCIFCFTIAIFLNNGILAGVISMVFQTIYYYFLVPIIYLAFSFIGRSLKLDVTQLVASTFNDKRAVKNDINSAIPVFNKQSLISNGYQRFIITPETILQNAEVFAEQLIRYMDEANKENYDISFVGFSENLHVWEYEEVRSFMIQLDRIFPYWFYFINKKTFCLMNITYSLSEYKKYDGEIVFNINSLTAFSEAHYNHLVPLWKEKNIADDISVIEVTEHTYRYFHDHYSKEEFYYLDW